MELYAHREYVSPDARKLLQGFMNLIKSMVYCVYDPVKLIHTAVLFHSRKTADEGSS